MDTRTKAGQFHAIQCLQKDGHDIAINHAMGKPRITRLSDHRDISPRLSTRDMGLWIDAYMAGYDAGLVAGIREGKTQ